MAENDDFLNCLKGFISETETVIEKLKAESEWMKSHHTRCNVTKTVGTTATVGGSLVTIAALALAPFTGGASIVAATGYAAATALAGSALNLATDITDSITSRIVSSGIDKICSKRKEYAEQISRHLERIQDLAVEFNKDSDLTENESFSLAIAWYTFSKAKNIKSKADEMIKFKKWIMAGKSINKIGLRNGGLVWKTMRLQSEKLASILAFFGLSITRKSAMAVVRSGTIIMNGIFAYLDIKCLIDSYTNDHPTVDAINQIIKRAEEELTQINKLYECVCNSRNNIRDYNPND